MSAAHDSTAGERRRAPRRVLEGAATGLRLDGDRFGETIEMGLVNFSDGGCLGVCAEPLEPGARLTLGFAPRGLLARRGVVRRCAAAAAGHCVALEFEGDLAA